MELINFSRMIFLTEKKRKLRIMNETFTILHFLLLCLMYDKFKYKLLKSVKKFKPQLVFIFLNYKFKELSAFFLLSNMRDILRKQTKI